MAHSAIWGHLVKWKWKAKQKFWTDQKFLRLVSENTASFIDLLLKVCEMLSFSFSAFCKFDWMTSSAKKQFLPFNKNKSLIQSPEWFDLLRLVLSMSMQNFKLLSSSSWEKKEI